MYVYVKSSAMRHHGIRMKFHTVHSEDEDSFNR